MVRTQVQLTQQQIDALRQLAAESGKSIAELVRLGVELYLGAQHRPGRKQQVERARRIAGRFSSGIRDVSTHHDRYLSEAYRE
ncbi:MAG: ribbon-helix-helix protein, CopG family [Acidobacteriia bacterium]|nr:ribbon-helix-helix protein, CopG family [Terriglobia bacterium]